MDQFDEQELIEFFKDNLWIEVRKDTDGESEIKTLEITLAGERIFETTI